MELGKKGESTHSTQMHNPTIFCCCIEIALKVCCTDKVDDNIDAFAICGGKDFLDQF